VNAQVSVCGGLQFVCVNAHSNGFSGSELVVDMGRLWDRTYVDQVLADFRRIERRSACWRHRRAVWHAYQTARFLCWAHHHGGAYAFPHAYVRLLMAGAHGEQLPTKHAAARCFRLHAALAFAGLPPQRIIASSSSAATHTLSYQLCYRLPWRQLFLQPIHGALPYRGGFCRINHRRTVCHFAASTACAEPPYFALTSNAAGGRYRDIASAPSCIHHYAARARRHGANIARTRPSRGTSHRTAGACWRRQPAVGDAPGRAGRLRDVLVRAFWRLHLLALLSSYFALAFLRNLVESYYWLSDRRLPVCTPLRWRAHRGANQAAARSAAATRGVSLALAEHQANSRQHENRR
jgi:hypothetical protein